MLGDKYRDELLQHKSQRIDVYPDRSGRSLITYMLQ